MRLFLLTVALCAAPLALAQPDPWAAAADVREVARARAFDAVAAGDPVAALASVGEALLLAPDDAELIAARDRLIPDAVPAAIARAKILVSSDQPAEAVELLADLRAVSADERLIEPLADARALNLLHEASAHEAAGRAEAAKRMIILAANIRPGDPTVLAALARNGIAPPPPPIWATAPERPARQAAPQEPLVIPAPPADFGRGNLERDFAFLDSKLDALTLQVARLERDTTLPSNRGAADSALTNLDRRVDDLQRSLERTVADLARQVSTLSRDVESLRRDVLRLR